MTLGEERVHLTFNPSKDDEIGTFKRIMADAIDFCDSIALDNEKSKNADEIRRCMDIAMEKIETACMYGVKGIAKTL